MADLEISGLEAYPLREPVSRSTYTVVRLQTRGGLTGVGECRTASEVEVSRARQVVSGKPATAYEAVRRELAAVPGMQAAVNIALLDIVGKAAKAPLFQVLGGPTRNKARALAPLHGSTDADLLASLKKARAAGFRAVAVPIPTPGARNQGQGYVLAAKRRLEAMRDAAADVDFVLEGGSGLTPGDASVISAAFERFHLLWFDEPCRVSNVDAIGKISSESVTPLGFGRHVRQAGEYQDLLRHDAVDILRPDLAVNGITQIRRIAALAETYYMAVAPYHGGGPVGTAAALHLAASLPNFFIQQIPFPEAEEDRQMRAELTGRPVEQVQDGYAALPIRPRLGIEVRQEILEKYKERAA
jgi:galactonate dehydratase